MQIVWNINVGVGLTDELVKSNIDSKTGDVLRPFEIFDGTYENAGQEYKRFKTEDMERNAIYNIKANIPINSDAYSYVQTQMSSGKIKFLIEAQDAKTQLLQTKKGQEMSPRQRNEYLMPFEQTNILRDQLANLVQANEGSNIILKRDSSTIPKDKVSALIYGMYYIKQEEKRKRGRKSFDLSKMVFMN